MFVARAWRADAERRHGAARKSIQIEQICARGFKVGGWRSRRADSEKREEPTRGEAGLLPLDRLPLRLLDLLAM